MIDRKKFFDEVRESLFNGVLSQRQVDGMNYLLDVWERLFDGKPIEWLAYALATTFHETAYLMVPLEEYGEGEGKEYGKVTGPHHQAYYGRGHVQLTWEENYIKAEQFLADRYGISQPIHQYPHRMLEDEPSALVLFDGMINGWFTGVGLPKYFSESQEDPYHARQIVNAMDHAETIAGYYWKFKEGLV